MQTHAHTIDVCVLLDSRAQQKEIILLDYIMVLKWRLTNIKTAIYIHLKFILFTFDSFMNKTRFSFCVSSMLICL